MSSPSATVPPEQEHGPRAAFPAASPASLRTAAQLGLWMGLSAGVGAALADFFAQWLWLDRNPERLTLLGSLLTLEGGLGAMVGGLLGASHAALLRMLQPLVGHAWARALVLFALVSPFALVLTQGLTSSSSLAASGRAVPLHVGAQLLTFLLALAFTRSAPTLHRSASRHRRLAVLGLALACFVVSKLDQHVYPSLYESLHQGLSLIAAGLAAGCAVYLGVPELARRSRASLALSLCAPVALIAGYLLADSAQNVRVAALHPRSSHAHSLAYSLRPLLSRADEARTRRAQAQVRDAQARDARGRRDAPVLPGAHLVLITVDALRADHLGAYGHRGGLTPNLDRFADRALRVEYAYTPAPHTSFALSALFTGTVIPPNAASGVLPDRTLPELLRTAGYHTAAFFTHGVFHTGYDRLGRFAADHFGFDRYEDTLSESHAITKAALAEMARTRRRGEPSSFFWVHYFDVHEPYRDTRYGRSPGERYAGEVSHVDAAIGALLAGIDEQLTRDTIVVLTADHGEAFREHGQVFHGSSVYEEQVRVPLLIRAPGVASGTVRGPAMLTDVSPTTLALLGIASTPEIHGQDLLAPSPERTALSLVNDRAAVIDPPYKLIAGLRFGTAELYDLARDPRERSNLADAEPARLKHMQTLLDSHLQRLSKSRDGGKEWLRLAQLGDHRSVPALRNLAGCAHCPTEERTQAAELLGRMGDASDGQWLATLAQRESGQLGAQAAVSAGFLGCQQAAPRLRALLSPSIWQRIRQPFGATSLPSHADVALALGTLGQRDAVPHLLAALSEFRDQHREADERRAISMLGHLRDERALPALRARIMDPYVGYAAVLALGELGDPRALPALLEAMADGPAADIRDNAAQALGQLGDPRAIPALRAADSARVDPQLVSASLARLTAQAAHATP